MGHESRNPLELEKIVYQEKIFEQDDDLHVRGIIFYPNAEGIVGIGGIDNMRLATREEFIDSYIKGAMLIASDDGDICKPVSMRIKEDYVAVSYQYASPGSGELRTHWISVGKIPGPL